MSVGTRAGRLAYDLREHDVVESTQVELAALAAAGAPEGTVVTARHQRRGRGRQGRNWWDGPDQSLLISILLRPPIPVAQAPALSQVAALATAEALERSCDVVAGIRWPNDVVVQGRKLGGILPEAVTDAGGRLSHVMLGIGLNIDEVGFPQEIADRATSLRLLTGRREDPIRLRDRLLEALGARYTDFLAGGFRALRDACLARSATVGAAVRLPDGRLGVGAGLDDHGALLARAADGAIVRIFSGDGADAARP